MDFLALFAGSAKMKKEFGKEADKGRGNDKE